MMNDVIVSVVIPTFNRADLLCRILPSYLSSAQVGEIIVVDDASTDNTLARVEEMSARDSRVRYLRNEHNQGAPNSRNRGALSARGTWVLEGEDDLALSETCIDTLVAHASANEADIIAGRRIWMRLGESEEQALARANLSQRPPFSERLMEVYSHAVTPADVEVPLLDATMLIRREVFERVRYYPPYAGPSSWREESDFQISAREHGYKTVFCPHAVTFHYSRASQSFGRGRIKGTAVYAYRVYRNNLLFLRRHHMYLRQHLPRSLILGSPLLSAVTYGVYRSTWLIAAEFVRLWRARRYGAFTWK